MKDSSPSGWVDYGRTGGTRARENGNGPSPSLPRLRTNSWAKFTTACPQSSLAHPFWFQSFGAVMGMDWHSSGITTSVVGALKRGLAPLQDELGIHVCGGRGRFSRQTPHELVLIGERVGFDGAEFAKTSRLVAKVDSAAVQDGFELYLHSFIIADDGHWTVCAAGNERGAQAGSTLPLAFGGA